MASKSLLFTENELYTLKDGKNYVTLIIDYY